MIDSTDLLDRFLRYVQIDTRSNDQSPTTLTDATSPMGQGDLTWAFEWDKELGAHGSFLISKDKQIRVPDGSSSLLLLGLALTGIRLLKSRLQRS